MTHPNERKQEVVALARILAEQAREEAERFEARALACEAIARSIEGSDDPEHWEREYQSMVGEGALELEDGPQEVVQ